MSLVVADEREKGQQTAMKRATVEVEKDEGLLRVCVLFSVFACPCLCIFLCSSFFCACFSLFFLCLPLLPTQFFLSNLPLLREICALPCSLCFYLFSPLCVFFLLSMSFDFLRVPLFCAYFFFSRFFPVCSPCDSPSLPKYFPSPSYCQFLPYL